MFDQNVFNVSSSEPFKMSHIFILFDVHMSHCSFKTPSSLPDTCYTFAGPEQWENMPNECYFPFSHNGKTYTGCPSDGKTQPWCATVVRKDPSKSF